MLAFGFIIRTKCPFLMPTQLVHTANVLHNIYLPPGMQAQAATALNSTLTMLMVEYGGRANLSGILKVELYELARLLIPNPAGLTPAPESVLAAADHAFVIRDRRTDTGFHWNLTATRCQIDEPVFAYLGLTPGEQAEVYEAAHKAIVRRQLAEARVS